MIKRVENLIPGDALWDGRVVESPVIIDGAWVSFEVSFRGMNEGVRSFRLGHELASVNLVEEN
jgi:hypothetical protein